MTVSFCLADADLLSSGRFGDDSVDVDVSTYRYSGGSDLQAQVTATVNIVSKGIIRALLFKTETVKGTEKRRLRFICLNNVIHVTSQINIFVYAER